MRTYGSVDRMIMTQELSPASNVNVMNYIERTTCSV